MQWIEEHLGVLVGFAVAGFYLVTQFLEAVKKQREK